MKLFGIHSLGRYTALSSTPQIQFPPSLPDYGLATQDVVSPDPLFVPAAKAC